MPPSLESEELIVAGSDAPDYARNKTSLPPLAAAIDPSVPIGRLGGKRSSSGRRSSRQDPLDRLRALPQIRPIPWYPGKELPPEKSTLSDRVQTRSACLMASRGKANDPPCSHCATGLGRFSLCISLDDFLSGACSTCHLAARGNSCSIRLRVASDTQSQIDQQEKQSKSPQGQWAKRGKSPKSSSQLELEPEPESSSEPHNRPPARGARGSRQPLPATSTAWTPVEHQLSSAESPNIPADESNSNLKRKRETLQGTDVWKPYVSPYRPVEPAPRNTSSRSRNSYAAPEASRDELPMLNYIYRKDAPVNGTGRHGDAATTSSPANSRPGMDRIWASTPENSTRATSAPSNERANRPGHRDVSASMSPSDQLLDQQSSRSLELASSRHHSNSRDKSSGSRPSARDAALLDSLPRKKQSQIYGLIDSLQSGINDCHRQAEGMQRQLDSLKAMLGIQTEGNNGTMSSS